ncbi:MAG: Wzz/FepE/Etk N-terminal domain-containing protein [Schleiferiaceae bacterium]
MNDSLEEKEHKTRSKVDDEITLKDIILKTQQWWLMLWPKRFWIIALSLAIGLMAALYTKFITKPIYTASYQLFFEEVGGGVSGAMRLASSFGFSLGGASGATSSVTVQEYLTSRDNISKAMMAELDSGRLVDRYHAELIGKDEEFAKEYANKFGTNKRYTDSVLTEITISLNKKHLVASMDEETGLVSFSVNYKDEGFVYDLSNQLIANTKEAFIDWKKEKSQDAVDAFQGKVDSLELAIDVTLRRLGEYEDQNNSLVSAVDKMKRMRLTIDMEALKVAYGEYIKGLEMSKAELMNLEPPFKYFDAPTYPLNKEKGSAAKVGILGSVITGFLLVLFFIGSAEAKNIMAN